MFITWIKSKLWFTKSTAGECWIIPTIPKSEMTIATILEKVGNDCVVFYQPLTGREYEALLVNTSEAVCTFDGLPVYRHTPGYIIAGDGFKGDSAYTPEESSILLAKGFKANLGGQMLGTLADLREKEGIHWKPILLGGAVIIGLIFLWSTGIIQSLFETVKGSF